MLFIACSLHPNIDPNHLRAIIRFNELMHRDAMVSCVFAAQGRPWEFNLRDVLRWFVGFHRHLFCSPLTFRGGV